MIIGLISDTHVPSDARMLPPHVKAAFAGVDLILHAGDIYVPAVLDELQTIAPVIAARGNGDYDFPPDSRVKDSHLLRLGGLKIGLTHAVVFPHLKGCLLDHALVEQFAGTRPEIVIYGDTHVALVERYNGMLFVNPGSPTIPNGLFELGTVGILNVSNGKAAARIIELNQFPLDFERKAVYRPGYGG